MKLYKKLLVICYLLLAFATYSYAQIDREFWFAAPNLVTEHTPNAVKLVIVSYDDDATISIEQPAANRMLLASRLVPKHGVFEFSISGMAGYRQLVETPADGQVHQTGIHVSSSADITAYYVTTDPNAEVYTLKGKHGLGTDFVVPTQFSNACGHNAYSSIEVVATDDNTQVTFTTFVPTNASATAGTISITLNRGETYALRAATANTPIAQHLGGTLVHSTKPVAVNTTDDSATTGGDLDLIGEQIVPTNLAGSRYILPANNSNGHEYVSFFPIEDSAVIWMVDATKVPRRLGVARRGGFGQALVQRVTNLQAPLFYSEDNMPFVAFHLTANENGNELSGTVLPSLNCSGSQEVNYTPSLSELEAKVTILVHTSDIGSFLVNGSEYELQAEAFDTVPGDSAWSYTSCFNLMLGGNSSSFCIQNTTGLFHLGILDNGGGACSYGFFSNYGQVSLYAEPEEYFYSVGDSIRLVLTGSSALDNIQWQGPNGSFATNQASPVLYDITEADAGMYIVSADNLEGCEVDPDTFFVHVFPKLGNRTKYLCAGDSLHIRAAGVGPFVWEKDGVLMPDQKERHYRALPDEGGVYTIHEKVTGCEMIDWTDTNPIDFSNRPPLALNYVLYQRSFSHLIPGAEYTWSVTLSAPYVNQIAPKVQLYVDDQAGPIVAVNNGTKPTVAEVRFVGSKKPVRLRLVCISPSDDRSLAINAMSLRPIMDVTEQIDVQFTQSFMPHILGQDTICAGETTTLSIDMEGTHYLWSTGDTTATIQASSEGNYYVYVWRGSCYEMSPRFSIGLCQEPEPEPEPCLDVVYQRWDDVLSVKNSNYNGGYEFSAFQWYRNGEPIPGAEKSYLVMPGGLSPADEYIVLLTLTDGTTIKSCPIAPVASSNAPEQPIRTINIRGEEVGETSTPGIYFIIYPSHAEKLIVR